MGTIAGQTPRKGRPLHLWIAGILSTVWNGFGFLDFALTSVREPRHVAAIPPATMDYIDALPAMVTIAWGVGVSFALLGSLLLLGRSLWAAYAFAISLLGLAANQFYQFATGLPPGMNEPGGWAIGVAVWVVAVGLLLYAIRLRNRRILR